MAAITRAMALEFGGNTPAAARETIRALLAAEPAAARRVYAALARKVWSLLVERRFDPEIRDWHGLIQQLKAHVRSADNAAAERLTALADLLRESISLAEASPAREVARRPNARRILELLGKADGFVARRQLLDALGLRSANLSNVLTQLVAHSLVERRDKGKEAEFRLTRLGRHSLENEQPGALAQPVAEALDRDVALLGKLLVTPPEPGGFGGMIDTCVFLTQLPHRIGYGPVADEGAMDRFTDQMFVPHYGGAALPVARAYGSRTRRLFALPHAAP